MFLPLVYTRANYCLKVQVALAQNFEIFLEFNHMCPQALEFVTDFSSENLHCLLEILSVSVPLSAFIRMLFT